MNVLKLESKGRLFFVSDIHAELPTLLHGLKELGYDSAKDMCIHAGIWLTEVVIILKL